MKHYLITEWNVDMLDLDWLKARRVLFEKYTLPSVLSQTNKDFTWILVSDTRTPDSFKKVLDGYPAEVLYFNFEAYDWGYTPPSDKWGKTMIRAIELELIDRPLIDYIGTPDTDFIITSRLDNDDAISVDHVDKIQTWSKKLWRGNRFWLNLTRGYKYCAGNVYPITSPHNPFISFVEPPTDIKTTYQVCHGQALNTGYPVEQLRVGHLPTWLQVIHGDNLCNKLMRRRGEAPYSTVSERFKINE